MQEPPVTAAEPAEPKGLSWGLESRLQFIDFRLRWERRINRMDLTEHFGISVPQASLDISKYMELAPSNLTYDRSSKTYTAAQSFHPLYQRSSAQRYLAELLATKMGIVEPTASFIGSAPETDWAPSPWRIHARVKALDLRQVRLHHLFARYLPPMDGPRQLSGIPINNTQGFTSLENGSGFCARGASCMQ